MPAPREQPSLLITALISWYDEQPEWLYELVSSLGGVCDRVVAVDGAYALFPGATGRSPAGQTAAIVSAARQASLGLTVYEPAMPWAGNEVEKRNVGMRLALDADWLFVLDADERLIQAPDLRERLEQTDRDSVVITHRFPDRPDGTCRKLYRTPVHIDLWHAGYVRDGREVSNEDSLWLEDVIVEHRKGQRVPGRQEAAEDYYRRREEEAVETR